MDLGHLLSLGAKLASNSKRESGSARQDVGVNGEPCTQTTTRRHEGGLARHGDAANPGQKNWRYALVDQGGGHTALRVYDGGSYVKQWNLSGKNEDGSYGAKRIGDLPGSWAKGDSLRHPEDNGIHAEGTLQAHRADADRMYATMQDGRGNGTFDLRRTPNSDDAWTLRFAARPKGVNDFAGEFARALQNKTASAFIRDRTLISLPDSVRADIKRFVPDMRHKCAPHYGMVVKELVKKCDPHNLATARAHVKEESLARLEKEVYAKMDGKKFVLLVNDKCVDGHHFIAKAERMGCTSSLDVLDLTGCRHQGDKKLAGFGLGQFFVGDVKQGQNPGADSENLTENETNLPSTDKTAGNGKLSCLMAPVPRNSALHQDLIDFARSIDRADLYVGDDGEEEGGKYGRELDPHCTVLYGFKSGDPAPIESFVQDRQPLRIVLDDLSVFEANDKNPYDVLKFDVKCPELEELNAALKEKFDVQSDYSKFHAHVTVAYLKPGRAINHFGKDKLVGHAYTAKELEFSDAQKKKIRFELTGKKKIAALDPSIGQTVPHGAINVPTTNPIDRLSYPLTGPLGPSTLAAAGIGAGIGGLLHAYRAGKRKLLHERPDPDERSFMGDVGVGALAGTAANVGFKGLTGMMGGPHPVDLHPEPYENPIVHSQVGDELPATLPPNKLAGMGLGAMFSNSR